MRKNARDRNRPAVRRSRAWTHLDTFGRRRRTPSYFSSGWAGPAAHSNVSRESSRGRSAACGAASHDYGRMASPVAELRQVAGDALTGVACVTAPAGAALPAGFIPPLFTGVTSNKRCARRAPAPGRTSRPPEWMVRCEAQGATQATGLPAVGV